MPRYRACIVGCGAIFPVHAEAIGKLDSVALAAVADIRSERADAAAAGYHCRAYRDWQRMLLEEKPDAVHICAPHYLHAPVAVFALRHGINVLTEKPVALNAEEAGQIAAARDASRKTAAVVFQNRLNDATVAAKEIVDGGKYGKITGIKGMVTWHRDDAYYLNSGWRGRFATEGGGVLMNQSIHTLDLLQYFAGEVESLRARVDNFAHEGVIEVEDTASAFIKFKSGARGLFYATTANIADSPVEIEIVLENAKIVIQGKDAFLYYSGSTEEISRPAGAETTYKRCWGQSHERLIKLFYDGLEVGKPFVSIEEGTKTLRIIEAVYRSSKSGAAVNLLN